MSRVPVRDHRLRAQRLGDRHAEQPDRPRSGHDDAFACDKAAEFRQPIHRRTGGDDQGRLLVRHLVGDADQRVDAVDGVFRKAAVSRKAVGAMSLVDIAVIQTVVVTGGIHSLAAALALSASRMDFDGDAFADLVFVDAGPERRDGPHIFVARREILVVGQTALDHRRRTVMMISRSVAQIATASMRTRTSARLGHRHGFRRQHQLTGIAQHPGAHRFRHGKIRRGLDVFGLVHRFLPGNA